ncbi:MAG: polyribonucleotide nucleotidyltransferase [Elusimicrobiales bacterium]|nr:polyribonucleotide nucleotidyltransferase [Elusimicrobiales bacterium]
MTDFNITRLEEKVGDKTISIETGLMAKQADGSVVIRMADTVLLASAVSSKEQKPGPSDFTPLTVNYKERTYAAGRIPGGFFKREGRPTTKEVLSSRLTDRSLRPLFPEGYACETNVTTMVLSSDAANDADVLSITAASAALMISSIPFKGPIAGVRVGMTKENAFILNPSFEEREEGALDLVIAGTLEGLLMVEGGGNEVSEETLFKALELAKPEIDKLCRMQLALREKAGKAKFTFQPTPIPDAIRQLCNEKARPEIAKIMNAFMEKSAREQAIKTLKKAIAEPLAATDAASAAFVSMAVEEILYEESRKLVIERNVRVDGRKPDEIRQIDIRAAIMPRTHGSTLFTRGQTQSFSACTLGTPEDMQLMEGLDGTYRERFMLHYNFPGFATGECKRDMSPGRREIGHGELARRSLEPLLPAETEFPYTIRIVSDIMESNGSSSMATVCGGSLSMFDAGVPLKAACAGIAMGLIKEGEKYVVLSDILGMEDHLGDMDFKLAGTKNGVTAFQMDVKVSGGISLDILKQAVAQASRGRAHILSLMETALPTARPETSPFAPKIVLVTIPQDKIGALIGPGGKNIRRITEETGAKIEVNDEGQVYISAVEGPKVDAAKKFVEYYTAEVEVGQVYKGKVVSIQNFGAFVEVLPGKEGLLHISEIEHRRIATVEEVLTMGQEIEVKIIEMDNMGKFRLSHKALLPHPGGEQAREREQQASREQRGHDRPRGGGRR